MEILNLKVSIQIHIYIYIYIYIISPSFFSSFIRNVLSLKGKTNKSLMRERLLRLMVGYDHHKSNFFFLHK